MRRGGANMRRFTSSARINACLIQCFVLRSAQWCDLFVLLVRLSVTVVCYYSWVSVRLPSSSTWLVRLNGDWTWHNCNRLVLGTERTRLVWGDDQSVVSFHICWPRSSNASKSSVRSSRSRSKYTFFNLGESTRSGLNDTCCEQLRVPFLATTLLV